MNMQIEEDRQRGLYRNEYEHDACGVGMVANLSGEASHEIVVNGMTVLKRLMHRGATGNDPETGDGAGIVADGRGIDWHVAPCQDFAALAIYGFFDLFLFAIAAKYHRDAKRL